LNTLFSHSCPSVIELSLTEASVGNLTIDITEAEVFATTMRIRECAESAHVDNGAEEEKSQRIQPWRSNIYTDRRLPHASYTVKHGCTAGCDLLLFLLLGVIATAASLTALVPAHPRNIKFHPH
jgi:hypothetical protein